MRLKVLSYVKTPDTMKINLNLFFLLQIIENSDILEVDIELQLVH